MSTLAPLIHPRLIQNLSNFFPTTVAIEQNTPTADPISGQPIESWAAVSGMESIKAAYNANFLGHIRFLQEFRVLSQRSTIYLNGYYPNIDNAMRIRNLDTDEVLLIRDVDFDSHLTWTFLVTFDSIQ